MRTKRAVHILVALRTFLAYDREVINGLGKGAVTFGNIVLHLKHGNQSYAEATSGLKIDGVIISALAPEEVSDVVAFGRPAVNVANYLEGHDLLPVVGNDDIAIGKLVAEHYLERGFKSFAYFANLTDPYFRPRQMGFCQTIEAAGYTCALGPPPFEQASAARADLNAHNARWLASLPRPVGIMCPWDEVAVQALHALRDASSDAPQVPEEASVIGVDNDPVLCSMVYPQISSVIPAGYKVGMTALDLLCELIDGKPPPAKPILLPPSGIAIRGSSSELPISDRDVAMAINYIQTHLRHHLTIDEIVKAVACSRRTLERKFFEVLGRTPLAQIRRARVAHARALLINTDLKLSEVARRSGLVWHQRLSKVIKSEFGITPAELRKQFQRN